MTAILDEAGNDILDEAGNPILEEYGAYPYQWDVTLYYLDYLDLETGNTLTAVPGNSYDMLIVNRVGLSIPPADGRWDPPGEMGRYALLLARMQLLAGRAQNAALHAANASQPVQYPEPGVASVPERTPPPDSLASARAHSADLHARMARGEKI